MFAYIQVIDQKLGISYGYVSFKFSNHNLYISSLKGVVNIDKITVPVSEIKNITEDSYYGWNRIKFNYNGKRFIFLYSGYGEFDYLKDNMLEAASDNQ
ncbi:hypothetical protein ACFQAV_02350 [Companilactobacillus huachuanensis]|uniref:GRAM domain-containing protein n=1 Tax=Companilactobacillus huachuanensis TaxID=2559914 RepID=A0ABW1RHV4_9LACO|nr:hypothetical protein [Companilactobacillus huachuanensis]